MNCDSYGFPHFFLHFFQLLLILFPAVAHSLYTEAHCFSKLCLTMATMTSQVFGFFYCHCAHYPIPAVILWKESWVQSSLYIYTIYSPIITHSWLSNSYVFHTRFLWIGIKPHTIYLQIFSTFSLIKSLLHFHFDQFGIQKQRNSSEVLRIMAMDSGSRKHLKNGCNNVHGVLHMYSGNSDASYVQNSNRKKYVFCVLQPLFGATIYKFTFPQQVLLRNGNATGLLPSLPDGCKPTCIWKCHGSLSGLPGGGNRMHMEVPPVSCLVFRMLDGHKSTCIWKCHVYLISSHSYNNIWKTTTMLPLF